MKAYYGEVNMLEYQLLNDPFSDIVISGIAQKKHFCCLW